MPVTNQIQTDPVINSAQTASLLPKKKIIQKSLLMVTVACAGLSLVPPLRLAGAFALRGTALLSSGINFIDKWKQEGLVGAATQIAQIAIVALGIAGLAAASPVLIIASLAADIALQTFELFKAVYHQEWQQALCHFGVIVIDTLALAGMAVGSWELMVAAASVSAAFMACLAIKAGFMAYQNKDPSEFVDIFCYLALTAVGITSAVTSAKIVDRIPKKMTLTNHHDNRYMEVYDKKGNLILELGPGEKATFTADEWYALNVKSFHYYDNKGHLKYSVYEKYPKALHREFDIIVEQKPLDAKLFPTLPLGGPSVALT